jgi:hypothetical protein
MYHFYTNQTHLFLRPLRGLQKRPSANFRLHFSLYLHGKSDQIFLFFLELLFIDLAPSIPFLEDPQG